MELFIFIFIILSIYLYDFYTEKKVIDEKNKKINKTQVIVPDELNNFLEEKESTVVNNYYIQNNLYVQEHNYNKSKHKDHTKKVWEEMGYEVKYGETYSYKHYGREIYKPEQVKETSTLSIKYSKYGLATKLKDQTGSKKMAKNILVEKYGVDESEAKRLVGYRS